MDVEDTLANRPAENTTSVISLLFYTTKGFPPLVKSAHI